MKLQITCLFVAIASALAAEEKMSPEQARLGLKKRGLQSGDAADGGADTGSSGGSCFSSVTSVDVLGQGPTSMDSLKIGDYVLAGNDEYSRVYSFAHKDLEVEADFLQILTEGAEAPIELTMKHMLFVGGSAVAAETVQVGDVLGDKKVVDISSVKRTGIFAPVTEAGDIVVNGVQASCYVAIMDHVMLNQHHLTHMFFSFQRAACSINFSLCENEGYTNGFSNWSNWATQMYIKANTFGAPMQHVFTAVCALVLPTWYTAEQFVVSPLLAIAAIGYLVAKANTKKAL